MRDFIVNEESGQSLVEYVVVLAGFIGFFLLVTGSLKDVIKNVLKASLTREGRVEIVIDPKD